MKGKIVKRTSQCDYTIQNRVIWGTQAILGTLYQELFTFVHNGKDLDTYFTESTGQLHDDKLLEKYNRIADAFQSRIQKIKHDITFELSETELNIKVKSNSKLFGQLKAILLSQELSK